MKVEDKIELQSVAKESCSSYLFMDGKLFSIFKSYTNKTLDVNTLSSYEPITMPVKHLNFFFFKKFPKYIRKFKYALSPVSNF